MGSELSGATLDRAYNPRLTIPDAEERLAELARASAAVLDTTPPATERYGPSPEEYVDVYPAAGSAAPAHIFIHGGFWRSFSARDYAFVAPPLQRQGVLTLVLNYALCPDVSLDEIVRQARAALAWTFENARRLGGDPERITVSGHSAGGHLAAMLAATDWAGDHGLPGDVIKAVATLSGLFDLEPLSRSWLQPVLQLDEAMVRRNSPVDLLPTGRPAMLVAVGGAETAEFHRQSDAFAEAMAGHGLPVDRVDAPGRNHIDILNDLRDGVGLHGAIVALARRDGAGLQIGHSLR